jgi:hypothetical protein
VIGIGGSRFVQLLPSHATGRADPHPAVPVVERLISWSWQLARSDVNAALTSPASSVPKKMTPLMPHAIPDYNRFWKSTNPHQPDVLQNALNHLH